MARLNLTTIVQLKKNIIKEHNAGRGCEEEKTQKYVYVVYKGHNCYLTFILLLNIQ